MIFKASHFSLCIASFALMNAGCGRVEPTPQQRDAAPPPAVATPTGGYRIDFPGAASSTFSTSSRTLSRLSFDLAVPTKTADRQLFDGVSRTGAAYPGSSDSQLWLIAVDGDQALCQAGQTGKLELAANLKLVPHDVVDLTRVRVDLELYDIVEPFPSSVGVCYGTHTSDGGWTWSAGLTPIAFDSPWVYGGPDGTAHVDLPIEAKHVDSVAIVYNEDVRGLFLKRITYWATRSP